MAVRVRERERSGIEGEAVASYHGLFEDEDAAAESCELLRTGQAERRLVFGEHPLSVAIRPQLIERSRYEAAVEVSHRVYGALQSLERALLSDRDLRAELDLDPEEERLAMADPPCRASSPTARLDGFLTDRLRYVEYNAETPAGIAYYDHLVDVFEALPIMRRFRERYDVTPMPVRDSLLGALLQAFKEWGRDEVPVIAIVDWTGLPTVSEFEMFRDYFEERGIRTVIADPRELELRDGRLRCGDVCVNLVYRRILTSDLIAAGDQTRALRDAYCSGAACVVNTFRAKLLHKKMSLALLSDDRYAELYTPAERETIAQHVPWTRKVSGGPTLRRGEDIPDLLEYIADHKDELVLKPNDEFGGKGVVLGWTVEQHEWEQDIEVACTQSYVVQERVPVPRVQFPVSLGGVHFLDFSVDSDPYLFDGRVCGCLTRISSSALLNVTAGAGSVVPAYVLDGPRS
jgi:uncharacterized circularly permuted ATP-grasp superfamily protein